MIRYIIIGLMMICCLGYNQAEEIHPLTRYNYHQLVVKFHEGNIWQREFSTSMVSNVQMTRLFTRPAFMLTAERYASGDMLPDLNTYYRLSLPDDATPEDAQAIIDYYAALPYVEAVYAEPFYTTASVDIPPTTPNFTGNQVYLQPAPIGLDLAALWSYNGGRGSGVRVADVEGGWHFDHEDLPIDTSDLLAGINFSNAQPHGTAIIGILGAMDNGYGVTGIAPDADYKVVSVFGTGNLPDIANAVNIATANTSPGDVILIELQGLGPASGQACTCLCEQFEQIPMEYWQANYDAIRYATSSGRIVLEVAGNGGMNLDHARYAGAFNRSVRDSGVIMVTGSVNHAPFCWSNVGSRVDLHHWGSGVVAAGVGDLFFPNGDINQAYTANASGSSSATAITAGGAIGLQGIMRARGSLLTPSTMRDVLRRTGYPAASGLIGTQADMRAATNYFNGYGTIYGIVTGNGSPVAGVTVQAGIYGSTITDANGRYTFSNVPLNNSVPIYADGRSIGYGVEWWSDQPTQATAPNLSITTSTPARHNINFTLTTNTTISGTVYDAVISLPISGVAVRVDGFPWEVCTAPNGTFTLDGVAVGSNYTLSAGGYTTTCGVDNYQRASQLIAVSGNTSGVNFNLNPAEVVNITEQELYQYVMQEVSQITFALFDFQPGQMIATVEVNNGTAQTVTIRLIDDALIRFEVSGGDAIIRQELPGALIRALDALVAQKGILPGRVLLRMELYDVVIRAEFAP